MKKVIALILFFAVCGLSLFVSATMIGKSDGNYAVSIGLSKGWNIVAGTMPQTGISPQSEIKLSDIKAMWYYSPVLKKYYQVYPTNELDNAPVEEGRQLDEDIILTSAMWVYSEKGGVLKYDTLEDYPLLNNRNLYAGYNFVTITPDMKGKSLREVKGNCNIDKVYHFESSIQEWSRDLTNDNFMNEKLTEEIAGLGILIKVLGDCKLGSDSVTDPPSFPTNGACTDTDNGLNYGVKGIVTTSEGSVSDSCNGNTLTEWICDSINGEHGIDDEYYNCPNGCSNGACVN